ncbi:unnamed protein product, partial [Hapterophycus canaliculatus]
QHHHEKGGEGNGDRVGRDEFLGILDLHHPHLMAHLQATTLPSPNTGGSAEGGQRRSGSRRTRKTRARVVGPGTLSVFDVVEANDDDVLCWDEVQRCLAVAL